MKDIIIFTLIIIIIHFAFDNKITEKFASSDTEAIANVASLYNSNNFTTSNMNVSNMLRVNRNTGDKYPTGWGGGIHTWDIYANGTVASGSNGELKAILSNNGNITGNQLIVNSIKLGNLTLTEAGDGGLRIQTASGWVDIGAKNTGWCHIYTDRPKFAIGSPLTDVATFPYNDYVKYNDNIKIQDTAYNSSNYLGSCGNNPLNCGGNGAFFSNDSTRHKLSILKY